MVGGEETLSRNATDERGSDTICHGPRLFYHLERPIPFESLDTRGTDVSLLAGQGHQLQVSPGLRLTETSLTEP